MEELHWEVPFLNRFRRHAEELKLLYCSLYHQDLEAYHRLLVMLHEAWEKRPETLRTLDAEREQQPDWYRARHLSCVQLAQTTLTETLQESYRAWISACHEGGMLVVLDFPMCHTSQEHPWAQKARAGEKVWQDRYFFYDSWDLPHLYDQSMLLPQAPTGGSHFTWCPQAGRLVMTTAAPDRWDLNYANPAVFHAITEVLLALCNQGVDILHLDQVASIWKIPGTTCYDLPQVHTMVRMLRIICEIVCPGVLLAGDAMSLSDPCSSFFGTPARPECHLLYGRDIVPNLWHTVATKDVRLLRCWLSQRFSLPKGYLFLQELCPRDGFTWDLDYAYLRQLGQEEQPHRRFLNDYLTGLWPDSLARGELLCKDPFLEHTRICGTTASLCGLQAAEESGDPSLLQRAIRLDLTLHALLFSLGGIPLLADGEEMVRHQAAQRLKADSTQASLFEALQRLRLLRAAHPAFDSSADTWMLDPQNDHILALGRYAGGEKLLALFNFSDSDETAWLQEPGSYVDLLDNQPCSGEVLHLPARGFRWLIHQD